SCVSTSVTPSNRSLPEMGNSTFGRECSRHPESNAVEQASSIVTLSWDRDMTLLPTRVRDDIDGDGPRVANGKRKQRQHPDCHQSESALRSVEEEHSAEYMEPV